MYCVPVSSQILLTEAGSKEPKHCMDDLHTVGNGSGDRGIPGESNVICVINRISELSTWEYNIMSTKSERNLPPAGLTYEQLSVLHLESE